MTIDVEAIYEDGVLKLKQPVNLPERAEVHVTIEAPDLGRTPLGCKLLELRSRITRSGSIPSQLGRDRAGSGGAQGWLARSAMRLTFVDAAVLIAAARGGNQQAARAMEILDDPEREFAASPFLRLEVVAPGGLQQAPRRRWHSTRRSSRLCQNRATDVRFVTEDALEGGFALWRRGDGRAACRRGRLRGSCRAGHRRKPSRSIHRARAVKVVTIYPG